MKIKQKIRAYLKKTGLKIYQLEDMAKVPRAVIYRYLRGERSISLKSFEKIWKIVG